MATRKQPKSRVRDIWDEASTLKKISTLVASLGAAGAVLYGGFKFAQSYAHEAYGVPRFANEAELRTWQQKYEPLVLAGYLETLYGKRERLFYNMRQLEDEQKLQGPKFPEPKRQLLIQWRRELDDVNREIKTWEERKK